MGYDIIDELLKDLTPDYGAEGLAAEAKSGKGYSSISRDESDMSFLDEIAGNSDHTPILTGVTASYDNHRVRATAAMDADNILGDALESLEQAQKAEPEQALKTFDEVLKGGEELLQNHTASVEVKKAALRIKRIAAKTAAQMAEDGVKTAADYADPVLAPHWASQVRKDVRLIRSTYAKLKPKKAAKPAETSSEAIGKKQMSDAEVLSYVKKLLNDGVEPVKIAAKIEKMAELLAFNKQISTDYLKAHQGVLGYAYMEPNTYMDKCSDSYERHVNKLGGVKAKSVKQIKACAGCQYFNKTSGSKQCNLYKLPIIASEKDLFTIVNNLTKGAKNKQAKLVSLANREDQHSPNHAAPKVAADHLQSKAHTMSNANHQRKSASFTEKDVLTLHKAGNKLASILVAGTEKVGPAEARASVRKFIAGLKGTKTKVALTQIDCTLLKGKLSASNAIIGARKCATCTYRRGMSCGLTGGTLERYEGMQNQKSGHKVASGAPKDGMGMLQEFDLIQKRASMDIPVNGPEYTSVDIEYGAR